MKIVKVNSLSEGSCSECKAGLDTNVVVNEIHLGVMTVRLCDNCLEDFVWVAEEKLKNKK